ncbi:hypothetical protein I4200191B4_14780 [Pseudoflavonifractor gallinarum]|uniref:cytochrome D ubiquinol oxidase subunit II n=1 Tax=Pseudoflavonifractor gallinarum TaxID=2779352 RepID=UPI0036F1CAC7
MNSEQITAFLQENWNWLCVPTEKPDSHRYGRGSRRVIFCLLGIVLSVVSIWSLVIALN